MHRGAPPRFSSRASKVAKAAVLVTSIGQAKGRITEVQLRCRLSKIFRSEEISELLEKRDYGEVPIQAP
jgi:hypothetical protein